jgi:hypothetical protein
MRSRRLVNAAVPHPMPLTPAPASHSPPKPPRRRVWVRPGVPPRGGPPRAQGQVGRDGLLHLNLWHRQRRCDRDDRRRRVQPRPARALRLEVGGGGLGGWGAGRATGQGGGRARLEQAAPGPTQPAPPRPSSSPRPPGCPSCSLPRPLRPRCCCASTWRSPRSSRPRAPPPAAPRPQPPPPPRPPPPRPARRRPHPPARPAAGSTRSGASRLCS